MITFIVRESWFNAEKNKGKEQLLYLIFKYACQVVVSGWSYVCFLFFLFYYFKNDGLLCLPLPLMVFLYFMVEEKVGEAIIWKISFLYVSFLIIFKFINSLAGLIQVNADDSAASYTDTIFIDNTDSLFFEGFLYFLIYAQLILLRRIGLRDKILIQEENTHMSYLRMKANKFISVQKDSDMKFNLSSDGDLD